MSKLLNESNFESIIDNAFNAVMSNSEPEDRDHLIDDIICEIRETVGDTAFNDLVNYPVLVEDIERKVRAFNKTNA